MDLISMVLANGYTDSQRLGYTYKETVHVLDETELVIQENEELGGMICAIVPELVDATFADGDEIAVKWDGIVYNVTAHVDDGAVLFGNMAHGEPDAEDTGEPFLYLLTEGIPIMFCPTIGTHTVSIEKTHESAKKIDKKFIGGVFERVDLYGEFGADVSEIMNETAPNDAYADTSFTDDGSLWRRIRGILDDGRIPIFSVKCRIRRYNDNSVDRVVDIIPTNICNEGSFYFQFQYLQKVSLSYSSTEQLYLFELHVYKDGYGSGISRYRVL